MSSNHTCFCKVFLLTIFFTAFFLFGNGQTISGSFEIDSLINKGFDLQKSNFDTAIVIAQKAIEWSQKNKYQQGVAMGYKLMATTFYFKGEHDKAIALYLTSLKQFELINDFVIV